METSTRAIVLRKVPYTGSSLILNTYTREFGLLSFMVRNLGGKKRKSRAFAELLSRVEITFHRREKYGIQTAGEIRHVPDGSGLFQDPLKGSVNLFLAEMLTKALQEESADPELYDYIESSLQYFTTSENHQTFHLLFLIKLSRFFGFFPQGTYSAHTRYFDALHGEFTDNPNSSLHTLPDRESEAWCKMVRADYESDLILGKEMRRRMLNAVVDYYRLHLEGFGEVKSLPVLIEVFSP